MRFLYSCLQDFFFRFLIRFDTYGYDPYSVLTFVCVDRKWYEFGKFFFQLIHMLKCSILLFFSFLFFYWILSNCNPKSKSLSQSQIAHVDFTSPPVVCMISLRLVLFSFIYSVFCLIVHFCSFSPIYALCVVLYRLYRLASVTLLRLSIGSVDWCLLLPSLFTVLLLIHFISVILYFYFYYCSCV